MISNKIPKISCVRSTEESPTDGLIKNFVTQTYPNKELVVLSRVPFGGKNDYKDHDHILLVRAPKDLTREWMGDLVLELTTGDIICWWDEKDDPMWLVKRYRLWCGGESDGDFFEKLEFYKAANMLYCGGQMNEEYWSKE